MGRKRKGEAVSGWINLDKPVGLGSTQAVSRVRRAFNAQKAGHAGTLDPLAGGVLPIALGEATKTVAYMMDADKTYRFTVAWGQTTTSYDREGEVTARSDVRPTLEAAREALKAFVGEISQVPPAFSAIKVDGERAYDLAREGLEFDLAARTVVIHRAEVVDAPDADHLEIEIDCGKGTYVRAIARDLAAALGACGHVSVLTRTREPVGMCPYLPARESAPSRSTTRYHWKNSRPCAIRAPAWRFCLRLRPRWTTSRRWP